MLNMHNTCVRLEKRWQTIELMKNSMFVMVGVELTGKRKHGMQCLLIL